MKNIYININFVFRAILVLSLLQNTVFANRKECLYILENLYCGSDQTILLKNNLIKNDVTELDVSTTVIKFPSQITSNFPNLKILTVHASYNMKFLNSEVTNSGPTLVNLTLSGNYFEKIEPNTFKNSIKLKYLDLSANVFEMFNSSDFDGLNNLEQLKLQQNRLIKIQFNICKNLSMLNTLWLQYNQIDNLNTELCKGHEHLKYLDLSYNKILAEVNITTNLTINLAKNLLNHPKISQTKPLKCETAVDTADLYKKIINTIILISVSVSLILNFVCFFLGRYCKQLPQNNLKSTSIYDEVAAQPRYITSNDLIGMNSVENKEDNPKFENEEIYFELKDVVYNDIYIDPNDCITEVSRNSVQFKKNNENGKVNEEGILVEVSPLLENPENIYSEIKYSHSTPKFQG